MRRPLRRRRFSKPSRSLCWCRPPPTPATVQMIPIWPITWTTLTPIAAPIDMLYLTIVGGIFISWLILATLFTPHVPYHIERDIDASSDHFIHVLESTCQ